MTLCNCKCSCTVFSVIASLILGIVSAFLQITGTITVTATFLWVISGVSVAYLAVFLLASAMQQQCHACTCSTITALLTGALGSILFASVLLAVGIVATSIISAILVGSLVLFFSLMLSSTACLIRNLFNCGNE